MSKRKLILGLITISILVVLIFFYLYSQHLFNNSNTRIAEDYLKSNGFKVEDYDSSVGSYVLTKKNILEMPYIYTWALQKGIDPTQFFNKTIEFESFLVKNHPLEYLTKDYPDGRVSAMIILVDNKAVGGVLFPQGYGEIIDTARNLKGETLQELYPEFSYPDDNNLFKWDEFKEHWDKALSN